MNLGVFRQLAFKYANNEAINGGDDSLGAFVNENKVLILKDKLVEVYDKLSSKISTIPFFIQLHEDLGDYHYLKELDLLLDNYVDFVNNNNLKECFSYSIRLIETLNQMRAEIKDKPRSEIYALDVGIRNLQDHIWKESKRILNIHDLRGMLTDFPEDIEKSIETLTPTWDFGPGKNPAAKNIKKRQYETPEITIKRLLKENEEEEKRKGK